MGDATRRIERRLVAALALRPAALPPALARAEGTWKGAPVRIETRAYTGPGVRWARAAVMDGGPPDAPLAIGNLLVLPAVDRPLPVFGADLVALGTRGGAAMVAADCSPMLGGDGGGDDDGGDDEARALRARQLAAMAAAVAPYAALPPGGELPAWCARWFSPHALYVRPGPAELARALEGAGAVAAAFVTLAGETAPAPHRAGRVAAAQAAYARAHREDDRGLGLLARMFGEAWAARYLDEVLFPAW